MLGVQVDRAPYATQPFLSRYYPDSAAEGRGAEHLQLAAAQHVRLGAMHLRRLPLVRVPVTVVWQDGSPAKEASILFQNPLFPHEAGIGSASVFPECSRPGAAAGRLRLFCSGGRAMRCRQNDRVA